MLCPPCIHSIHILTKLDCFTCLESIRNKFMPLGNNLFAAKLKYLQRGGGCCKKRGKKLTKLIWWKIPHLQFFFLIEKGYFDQKYPRNPKKIVPMLYNNDFWHKLVDFVVKRPNEKKLLFSIPIFNSNIALIPERKKIKRCGCRI